MWTSWDFRRKAIGARSPLFRGAGGGSSCLLAPLALRLE